MGYKMGYKSVGAWKRIILTSIAMLSLSVASAFAAHSHPEKYYQAKWCAANNGQAEVILPDKTRADCITTTHAIEFDFGKKWAERARASPLLFVTDGKTGRDRADPGKPEG